MTVRRLSLLPMGLDGTLYVRAIACHCHLVLYRYPSVQVLHLVLLGDLPLSTTQTKLRLPSSFLKRRNMSRCRRVVNANTVVG